MLEIVLLVGATSRTIKLKSRSKGYEMADSGDDDESVMFSVDNFNGEMKNGRENDGDDSRVADRHPLEGHQFEGEWGYSLVKALRGKTPGRRLRRALFKFGLFQVLCGIPLLILTSLIFDNFRNTEYYDTSKYGATLMELMWLVSFPTVLISAVTLTAVRNWASLTTNRRLLSNLMRCYMLVFGLMFFFTLWCACVLFLVFQNVDDWNETLVLARIFPYYVCTIIFLMPYLASQLYYELDFAYIVEEIDMGGTIAEPDPPPTAMDLSDVTLLQSCIFICAMPCILCIQCFDLIKAIGRAYTEHYKDKPLFGDNKKKKKKAPPPKKKRRFLRRVWKTIVRLFKGTKRKADVQVENGFEPSAPGSSAAAAEAGALATTNLALADLTRDREKEERLERERAAREREERQHQMQLEQARIEEEKQRLAEQQLLDAARILNERKQQQAEEERLRLEKENAFDAVLNVGAYKALWSSLSTAGSFQCNLKSLPPLATLTDHLKKQGFGIVFAANPSPTDVEVGVCNVRKSKNDSWFMSRFLATEKTFSAVMKAEKPEEVTAYVKKFALAKVLKIEK